MESDLVKQLEDKKKEYKELYNSNHKNFPNSNVCRTCAKMNRCQAEIAILEQAIAEIKKRDKDIDELAESSTFALMQRQRQNFIDIINSLGEIRGKSNDLQCIKLGESFSTNSVEWLKKELLKQLNQPKEEGKE